MVFTQRYDRKLLLVWDGTTLAYGRNFILFKPGHEKMCLMSYANNKGAVQTSHPRSLISALVNRCLDSIISLDSTAEISRL